MTNKKERFCKEYIIDLNATQAAIRTGYSSRTAYSQGQRLLKDAEVRAEIDKMIAEKDESLIAKQDEILSTLTRILRRQECENVVVVTKNRKSKYDKNGKKQIVEEETPKIVEIPPKLADTNKAAELLGRYYTLWNDNVNISGDMGVTIVNDIPKNSETD